MQFKNRCFCNLVLMAISMMLLTGILISENTKPKLSVLDNYVCQVFDMSASGWKPINSDQDRLKYSLKVKQGKGRIEEMETIKCVYRYGDEHLGEVKFFKQEQFQATVR